MEILNLNKKLHYYCLYAFFLLSSFLSRYIDYEVFEWRESLQVTSINKIIVLGIVFGVFLFLKYKKSNKEIFNDDIFSVALRLMMMYMIMNIAYVGFYFTYRPTLYLIAKSFEYIILWDILTNAMYTIMKTYTNSRYAIISQVFCTILLVFVIKSALI